MDPEELRRRTEAGKAARTARETESERQRIAEDASYQLARESRVRRKMPEMRSKAQEALRLQMARAADSGYEGASVEVGTFFKGVYETPPGYSFSMNFPSIELLAAIAAAKEAISDLERRGYKASLVLRDTEKYAGYVSGGGGMSNTGSGHGFTMPATEVVIRVRWG